MSTTLAAPAQLTSATAAFPQSDRLAGKVALITGGNSGIGLASAAAFLAAGASVAIAGRDQKTLDAAVESLGTDRTGGRILAVRADVADLAQVGAAIEAVRARFGRIDTLFVNAGIAEFAPVDQATEAHFDRVFGVNVKGAYFTIQKALPVLARGASVILTGSVAGELGIPAGSVYSATKAAVRSLARTMSADLKDRGIRVNVVSPGPIVTPIFDRLGLPADAAAAAVAGFEAQVPLGRMGTAAEIANAAVFLASDESSFFVGAELVADGGLAQL